MHTIQDWRERVSRFFRQRWIALKVRRGILPPGVELGEIYEALRHTKPRGVLEVFGFLSWKQFRNGRLFQDGGLQSVKLVTTAFANYLVDELQASNANFSNFKYHDQGDDNTAESNAHTALQNSMESRGTGTQTENGANRYKSVCNITATANYTAEEHGLFNEASAGIMMDRNLPANAPVLEVNDVVEWTYELLVSAES